MGSHIIDLSLTFRHGMRGIEFHPKTSTAVEGFNTTNMLIYSHAGTHLDAPLHFIDGGLTIERLNLHKCAGPAYVIDVSHKEPHSLITIADLGVHQQDVQAGSRILLHTGWDSHADQPDYRTHFPRISLELARFFVERRIWLLGVEMPSVASLRPEAHAELRDVHRTLLEAEIVIVESLVNLRAIRSRPVMFVALPLKLDGRDGSPVRAIAIEEDIIEEWH